MRWPPLRRAVARSGAASPAAAVNPRRGSCVCIAFVEGRNGTSCSSSAGLVAHAESGGGELSQMNRFASSGLAQLSSTAESIGEYLSVGIR